MTMQAIDKAGRSDGGLYTPEHRMAVRCALLHLAICAGVAVFTDTWAIVLLVGLPAVLFPAWIALRHPQSLLSKLSMAAGYMALTGLIIQQTGGDMEAHFSFFVLMSILVVYNDWRPLAAAFLIIILHHLAFTILHPQTTGITGFYVWNDDRNIWGHLAVHAMVGTIQFLALAYLAEMLRQRSLLEAENAALGSSLRHVSERADRDPLTGLFNRRHLDDETERLAPLVQARAVHVGVLAIDIDHFKLVNDRYGHSSGDDVLKSVADTIQSALGPDDRAFRQGGEEFLVLTFSPENHRETDARAEAIRSMIAVRPVASEIGPITVTASVGTAEWQSDEDFETVIRRADRALYQAKRDGRNRVVRGNAVAGHDIGTVRASGGAAAGAF